MAKLTITRPNGDTEYAELTTNKSLVGDNYLTVEKSGTTYYAKLASNISTHMYVIKPYSSTKLYVQKKADKKKYKIRIDQDYPNQQEVNVTINGHYYCYDGVEEFEEGTEWKAWVYNRDSGYENGHIVGDTSGTLHKDIHVWATSPTRKSAPTPPPTPPTPPPTPSTWKYVVDDSHSIDGFVIPKTGKYKITFSIFEHILRGHRKRYDTTTEEVNLTQGDRPYDNKIAGIRLYTKERDIYDNSPMIIETKMKSIEYIGEA